MERKDILKRMEYFHVPGISMAVIDKGQISWADGFGTLEAGKKKTVQSNSIFSACSISKFATSMLVLKLVEQEILDLDENINNKLISWKAPNNEFTQKKPVTLRSLLCHQSGIMDPDNSFGVLKSDDMLPSMVELLEGKSHFCLIPIEVMAEPWSEFHYSDAGYCIIQLVIEDVVKKPFHQVINEFIFEPLQMKNSTYTLKTNGESFSYGHYKSGKMVEEKYPIYPYPASSGLWTTPIDLAHLVIDFMGALKGESELGISVERAIEMITPHGGREWAGLGVFLYGSGNELEMTSLGWGVGFQCMLASLPHKQSAAVIMTNAELGKHQMEGIIGEIYEAVLIDRFI